MVLHFPEVTTELYSLLGVAGPGIVYSLSRFFLHWAQFLSLCSHSFTLWSKSFPFNFFLHVSSGSDGGLLCGTNVLDHPMHLTRLYLTR